MTDADILKWLTGGSVIVSALGYAAWWGFQRAHETWRKVERHEEQIGKLTRECELCRSGIHQRLADGVEEFHKTRLDILGNAKSSVEKVADLKEQFYKGFVSEATFKDRVLSEMTKNCKNFEAK